MELWLRDGDYVPDGRGGLVRSEGAEALLQRVLFRLCARRGEAVSVEDVTLSDAGGGRVAVEVQLSGEGERLSLRLTV